MDLTNTPEHTRAGLQAMNAGKPLAMLTTEERRTLCLDIVERTIDGADMAELATEFGVHRKRLYQLLLTHAEEEWRGSQVVRALARVEDAEDAIDTASDGLELARAREALRSSQWQLEKLYRRLYGADVAPAMVAQVRINIEIAREPVTPLSRPEREPVTIEGSST